MYLPPSAVEVIDLLAEARIKEWENRERGTTSQPEEKRKARGGEYQKTESFEKQLLQEIYGLIEESTIADSGESSRNDEIAKGLEVQLMASLEKQGLNLTAKRISEELAELRAKNREL